MCIRDSNYTSNSTSILRPIRSQLYVQFDLNYTSNSISILRPIRSQFYIQFHLNLTSNSTSILRPDRSQWDTFFFADGTTLGGHEIPTRDSIMEASAIANVFSIFSKFSWKFVEKIQVRSSFGRRGKSGKSRAARCQNSSFLRRLAITKTSKKWLGKKSICLGFGNQFFVIFGGCWRESTIFSVKINFLVKFCSRYTYSEIRATKNCGKTTCAARTWPPPSLPARAQIYI